MEANLIGSDSGRQFALFDIVRHVTELNHRAMAATNRIISFKSSLRRDVLSCGVFSFNYPLLIDHVLEKQTTILDCLKLSRERLVYKKQKKVKLREYFNYTLSF
ncbi:DUF2935 domain-containing protein [Clostridium thailandense]|uniref:DUF2935 domain-containing protein n=1 Tax=Clostridium thailandense TaxID=2794346 RepID=UPI003988BA41